MCVTTQDVGSGRQGTARAGKSQFAGFGVAPEREALRGGPPQLRLDPHSMPMPRSPSEPASDSPLPVGRKQVCHWLYTRRFHASFLFTLGTYRNPNVSFGFFRIGRTQKLFEVAGC